MPKLINNEEIKKGIKSKFVTFVNFSKQFDAEYGQVIKTLNGNQFYPPVVEIFQKAGFEPKVEYKRPKKPQVA